MAARIRLRRACRSDSSKTRDVVVATQPFDWVPDRSSTIAIAADMKIEQLALVPFSFPTYAKALGRAAILAARKLEPDTGDRRGRFGAEAGVP